MSLRSCGLRSTRTAIDEELTMKAYVIAAETVNDQAMFDAYRKEVPATLVPFGGTFIARGGNLTTLEGEWPHPRLVIIEFPSRAAAEAWYGSTRTRRSSRYDIRARSEISLLPMGRTERKDLRSTAVGWAKARERHAHRFSTNLVLGGGHAEPVIGPRVRADPLALRTLRSCPATYRAARKH
jgi:uncharacterized protein (DUF1330 family)